MSEYVYIEPGNKGGAPKQYSLCSNRAYGQTLFLGCSIKSYNSSLGWNGEASRLTVEIIEDNCSYPNITDRPVLGTDHYTNNRLNNTFNKDSNGLSLVPGKVYYVPENDKIVSKYHYGADPGFIGETIDLMGCPVYFKHDDFEFVGIVKSWDTTGDSGGTKSYSIIIESPAELLQNTTAIIGEYHGFIFRRSASTQQYGFPGYLRVGSDDVYSGTIAQQNTPNVLNPYGYWEQLGFGGANKNDQGMPAIKIIDAITILTSTNFNVAGPEIYKYSSFARILGRSPTYKSDGSFVNYLDHTNCGMILPISDVFDYPRMGYRLDLSQIRDENLLQYYRVSGSTITLYELISNICSNTGKEYYLTLNIEIAGNSIVPIISVNTISVLNQPPEGAINAFIEYAKEQGTVVTSYSRGEEYNSGKSVRSMYIGGKQQRLYQVKNTKYSSKQITLRYNAYSNQFLTVDHTTDNLYKIPDENNTRNPDLYNSDTSQYGRVELSNDNDNYKPLLAINGSVGSFANGYYASSDADAICPYFGNDSITGGIRPVYHHYTGWVVRFNIQEIGSALNYMFTDNSQTVLVSESEIRAAMVGVDSYVGFMSAVLGDGAYLDVWEKVIRPIVGPIATRAIMSHGIMQVYNAYNNSRGGTSSVPMGSQSASLSESLLFNILNKLQKFFGDIGNTYYGKQFMVTIPTPSYWTDSRPFNPPIRVGSDAYGNDIYMLDGSQQTYYSFEPADFAWEEPGNMIDDYLMIGSSDANVLAKEDGSFETILAYNGSYQVNYPKVFAKTRLLSGQSSPTTNAFNFAKFETFLKAGSSIKSTLPQDFLEPGLDLTNNQELYIINVGFQNDAYNTNIVPAQRVYSKASVEKTIYPYVTLDGSVIAKIIVTCDGININPIYPEALSVNVASVEYLANNYVGLYADIGRQILSLCGFFNGTGSQDKDNAQYNNLSLAPKAAIPDFAAIPIQFNNAVYGPWVSSPDIAVNNIFNNNGFLRLENLVGGTKVEIDADLVPWNYGGMRVLDEAAMQKVGADNDYRSTIEQGRLVIYGLPTFGLGQELKYAGYLFNGPTINNIQVQINENGPSTTYTFRTFTRKFTLFNKENADKLKSNALNTLKLNKVISQNIRSVISKIRSSAQGGLIANNYTRSKLLAYSPMNLLVGYSQPYINRKARRSPGIFSPGNWTLDSIKRNTTVTVQDARELPQEFDNQYASKSIMSLDGLFTPASFYPTFLNSTTHFKKYQTEHCPFCNGTKYYLMNDQQTYCFYCASASTESMSKIASITQMPPFILSNEVDASIIENPNAITSFVQNNVLTKSVNYINLNPFIMPVGEFKNQFAQEGDYTSHHINIVARSLTPMKGSLSFNDNLSTDQDGLEYYDQNNEFCDLDWNDKVFNDENGIPNSPNLYQTNYRFISHRGPLLINGWGFDTEGYPVPNASGDPKFVDDNGNPLRINNIYDQGSTDPAYAGDIIVGKNQFWDGTKWSAPYKEMSFSRGWGLRPDTWPVGPVDLRWDNSRKVWTAPSNSYRLVNVQLEDNLLPPFPARGFLNAVDKTDPLPSGLRRLVFVKDSAENYGAPRGAKLLCFYDDTTGFYEPINKQNIMTSGIIRTDGTALIYNSYSKGFDTLTGLPENPELIQVYFSNMLNFNIYDNQIGLFTFMKDQWVLTSANSCHSDNIT